jgi:FKBP-type peptidyl-prolyl cis-trans isomerase
MKKTFILILSALCFFNTIKAQDSFALKTLKDSFSYAFGASIGMFLNTKNMKDFNWDIYKSTLMQTMQHGDSGLIFNSDQLKSIFDQYIEKTVFETAKIQNDGFFESKRKEGYLETSSGMLYKIEKAGNGKKGSAKDSALVYYSGSFINGKIFDSNIGKEAMKTALTGGLIAGFLEALLMMDEGSTYEFIIPYQLAYGSEGQTNPYSGEVMIEPYQTMVFKITLQTVIKAKK